MFCLCRKDDAYYDSLAAKARAAAGGGDNMSDTSDADPDQLLREMVRPHPELLSRPIPQCCQTVVCLLKGICKSSLPVVVRDVGRPA